jgi:hypothetical protein
MSSRTAVKGKGKASPSEPLDEFPDNPSDDEGDQSGPSLDVQANLLALQNAQVNQAIIVKDVQKQMGALELGMAQILAALNKPTPPVTSATPSQFAQVVPDTRASPAPSGGSSQSNDHYKRKFKDAPVFDNNEGDITYLAWKQQVIDIFEEYPEHFPTQRSHMRYLFNRTRGTANKHLYPRYTSEEDNQNPYTTYQEILATLDSVFKNQHQARDSRNKYRELKMGTRQSFHDFKTEFLHLANEGRIPEADRFHDIYDKLTTALQRQVVHQLHTMGDNFETLCMIVAGIDVELRRINARSVKEKEAALSRTLTTQTGALSRSSNSNPTMRPPNTGFTLLQRPSPALAKVTTPNTVSPAIVKTPEPKCYNCFEPGHLSRDCAKPRRATVNDIEGGELADMEEEVDFDDQGKEDA